ncbi:MAG TPA: hypothetical protein VM802_08770 [Chitinophaga sp.]|uniref:hypothetical protein n=1 Tax=Chitinophaga sp. TaxID=1869181 RepID=UPI002C44F157|nr:hypothetical protein [Chitinophaga sp.]HVI44950.1 hypothetical protein [Chitinophaga sp.]
MKLLNTSLSPRLYVLALLLSALFLQSCMSGEKLYNKGRYDAAVTAFVKKLHRKPQDATALKLLPAAYEQAVKLHEERVNRFLASNNELKWESVRAEYRTLQTLYNAIRSSPAAMQIVTPKDYSNAITGAQENAAEIRYERGVSLMERGDKASARQAYDEFAATLKLVKNYRDTKTRMDEAFQAAVINVVVSEVDVRSLYYQFTADQFRDYLVRDLQMRNINRFVQFYDERVARGQNLRPDQYIEMRFLDFVVGQTYYDRIQRDVSKEIVTGTAKDTSGRIIEIRTTVRATLYITTKTVVSRGILDYRILDTNNSAVLRTDRIPGSFTWQNQFGTYRGDYRALSEEDKQLIGGREEIPPPPDELFKLFTQPIFDQLTRDLQTFYNRF